MFCQELPAHVRCCLLLLVLLFNPLFAPCELRGQEEPVKKWAFVAGVSRYGKSGWDDLRFCEKDARDLKVVLENLGFQVTALIGPKATKKEVEEQFKQFLQKVKLELGKEDIVLVYFSGHGVQRRMEDDNERVETPFFCPI
jgi:uncharacterized caspase-like protein